MPVKPLPDKTVIDLGHKATEIEWFDIWDRFYLAVAPEWFKYLSWVGIVAVLQLLNDKKPSVLLALLIGNSLVMIWRYFYALLARIEFIGLPGLKSSLSTKITSHVISGGLGISSYFLARVLVQIMKNK